MFLVVTDVAGLRKGVWYNVGVAVFLDTQHDLHLHVPEGLVSDGVHKVVHLLGLQLLERIDLPRVRGPQTEPEMIDDDFLYLVVHDLYLVHGAVLRQQLERLSLLLGRTYCPGCHRSTNIRL